MTGDDPTLIGADKQRGLMLGLYAGEILGRPVDGLDRDTILRRHGRVVNPLDNGASGKLLARARKLGDAASASRSPTGGDANDLLAAVVRSATATPSPAIASDAAAILAEVAGYAHGRNPLQPLDAVELLAHLDAPHRSVAGREGLAILIHQVRSPPSPDAALTPLAGLTADLALACACVGALLVRPASVAEAVVYAVNLGGQTMLRGALVGAIAGVHRGGAGIPTAWLVDAEVVRALRVTATRRRFEAI